MAEAKKSATTTKKSTPTTKKATKPKASKIPEGFVEVTTAKAYWDRRAQRTVPPGEQIHVPSGEAARGVRHGAFVKPKGVGPTETK